MSGRSHKIVIETSDFLRTGDPMDWLRTEMDDLDIDSDTDVTEWEGESIDWPLAVGHLFD